MDRLRPYFPKSHGKPRVDDRRVLSGIVIWSAPRIFAFSFVPALAIFVLSLFAIGSFTLTPRPGQEGMMIPSLIFIGGIWTLRKTHGV